MTGNLVLLGKRHKNVYKAKIVDSKEDTLKCLTAVSDCSIHKRMGHISMTTINKLISKDLVRGLPTKISGTTKYVEPVFKENRLDHPSNQS